MNKPVVPVNVRFPDETYKKVKELAERERRSLGGQVLKMVEDELCKRKKARSSTAE